MKRKGSRDMSGRKKGKNKKEKATHTTNWALNSAGLTEIEMKLLTLALDKGAYEGEAENAAVMFVRKLRERNVKVDDLFVQNQQQPPQNTAVSKYGDEKMTFGKHRGEMIKNVPLNYLIWAINNCANMDSKLRLAIHKFIETQ